jgi:hypothetical protein
MTTFTQLQYKTLGVRVVVSWSMSCSYYLLLQKSDVDKYSQKADRKDVAPPEEHKISVEKPVYEDSKELTRVESLIQKSRRMNDNGSYQMLGW